MRSHSPRLLKQSDQPCSHKPVCRAYLKTKKQVGKPEPKCDTQREWSFVKPGCLRWNLTPSRLLLFLEADRPAFPLSFFFFKLSAAPRDLPSSPTRPSPD